jgi:hypothetical protein
MFGQKKTPKLQKEDTTPYTEYNIHSIDVNNRKWPSIIRIISIDPGVVNLCIRVEERSIDRRIKYVPKSYYYEKTHMPKDEMCLQSGNENTYYAKFLDILERNWDLFNTCHVLIMERQLPINYKAVRISQHILTYFLIKMKNLPQLPMIFEINSTLKTKEHGIKHLNAHGVKAWSIEYALNILNSRNDVDSLNIINKSKKKDDLADTVTQIEAFCIHVGWPRNSEILPTNLNSNPNPLKINIIQYDPRKSNTIVSPNLNQSTIKLNVLSPK